MAGSQRAGIEAHSQRVGIEAHSNKIVERIGY